MRRVLGLENLGEPIGRSALTIGKFFAVHRGHQALLQATDEAARIQGAEAVAVTFDRHPGEVLRPGTEYPILATLEERLELIEQQGVDTTVVLSVTPELLSMEPELFVRDVLVRQLGAVEILASAAFRFGRGARGSIETLRRLGPELGFRWTDVPTVDANGERISSSRVAACIEEGSAASAAALLGRYYSVTGTVVRGQQLGRQLGFPTANVRTHPRRLLPADGVYVARLCAGGPPMPAVANLGVRPTVDGAQRVLEVHALDWTGELYDREVRVEFVDRVRGEQRFPSVEALKEQIGRDVERARQCFRHAGTPNSSLWG